MCTPAARGRMTGWVYTTAGLAGLLAVLLLVISFSTLFHWMTVVVFSVAGFGLGAASVLCSGKNFYPKIIDSSTVTRQVMKKVMDIRRTYQPCKRRTVTTMNLDMAVQQILELTTRDYVISWYQDLGQDQSRFSHLFQDEMWAVFQNVTDRLHHVEYVPFMTRDVINIWCRHFQKIRVASKPAPGADTRPRFGLHPWIHTAELEEGYLRALSSASLLYLLPESYARCKVARHLFTEILACTVLKPMVDLLCDPDYINHKIFGWLDYRQKLAAEHKRTYTYAATYEDFINIIERCTDIEHLRHMRYNIIAEIMQSTTIQNLKRAKGLAVDKESSPKGTTKGDLLKARNLKRYINQLTVAKTYCEKKIYLLGGPDYKSYTQDGHQGEDENIPGKKVLAYSVIMGSAEARNQFMTYLRRVEEDMLLRFWISVEGMRLSNQRHWHTQAGEVYQMFISHPSSIIRHNLERSTIRAMEAFMIGDKGPEAFWEAHAQVSVILEEQHYPSFILSDICHKYVRGMEGGTADTQPPAFTDELHINPLSSPSLSSIPEDPKSTVRIAEHSTYAQTRLAELKEKATNKTRALQALRLSQKPDAKMRKLQEDIENEILRCRTQRKELEFHIDRTDLWLSNLGRWQGHIYNAEIVKEEEKMVPYFVIVVDLHGAAPGLPHPGRLNKNPHGWVVSRTLDDFSALHRKLIQIDPGLKSTRLPTVSKFRVKSLDTEFLNKSKDKLQDYITSVLSSDGLSHSEAVFAFLSPSPEYLKHSIKSGDKCTPDSDSDDELLFGDDESPLSVKRKDSIAGPLYRLIMEVFEIRGAAKFLRRTLMVFVQVTFGKSTDRQLRETVHWMFSEPMMIYYLHLFRDSFWPDGKLAEPPQPRSDQEKVRTRKLAKEKLLENIPDALKNLVGEQNARKGMVKMFESFQDARLNKQLFYDLLEPLVYEMFPELAERRRGMREEREEREREEVEKEEAAREEVEREEAAAERASAASSSEDEEGETQKPGAARPPRAFWRMM